MKKINNDAKVLIRSYIDNVEEYLKSTCKMHPNEIDSLLNEINDFMFIRSNELATGETISHSNVLEAMEECGSPSEICDQYLEPKNDQTSHLDKTKAGHGSKKASVKKPPLSFRGSKSKDSPTFSSSTRKYLEQLRQYKLFAIYRVISAFTFIMLIIMVATRPFGDIGASHYYLYVVEYFTDSYISIGALWVFNFLFFEGWLIHRWKQSLLSKGFLRKLDDDFLIIIARIGFLVLIFKASLLPLPWRIALFFPLLIVLQILLERQLKTDFWIRTISPFLIRVAHSVDAGKILSDFKQIFHNWRDYFQYYSRYEKLVLSIGGPFLLFSLLFPWGYGWQSGFFQDSFFTSRLIGPLNIHLFITSAILIAMIVLSFSEAGVSHSNYKLNTVSFWVGRILGIRTLMMVTAYTYNYSYSSMYIFTPLLILTYVFFETTVGFQRHLAVKRSIVSGLQYLGQDPALVSSRHEILETLIPDSPSNSEIVTVPKRQRSQSSMDPSREVSDSKLHKILRGSYQMLSILASALYIILTPVFSFIKAFVIALVLLLGSVYEVLLFLLILLTGTSMDGSYAIPTYSFASINSGDLYQIGGFTIWSWYLLGALTAQIFILVVIEWFQFVRKKPDGIIIIFFRNFSRLLILGLFLGSCYQGIQGDLYAMPRIVIMIVLVIFLELTSLKIRLERRKCSKDPLDLPIESDERTPSPEKSSDITESTGEKS
ncbi:hypothetical protein CEE45_04770 [Candidatus Heimdallarchaeota archaeon B3_Heim]|nr:MAG: hypothetical protein CEE45_04770 [Candidatus Heimdallarchaeota archaeon B3_Heim]